MRTKTLIAILLVIWTGICQAKTDGPAESMRRNGDAIQIAIPVFALGAAIYSQFASTPQYDVTAFMGGGHADLGSSYGLRPSPVQEFAYTMLGSQVVTYGLKYAVNAERPDGGGQSFPSGHTSAAFTGAEFIREQYGWGWGGAAYLAASYVGYSRIASERHHGRDVLAGAVIGILANHLGPWNDQRGRGHWLPTISVTPQNGIGFGLQIQW